MQPTQKLQKQFDDFILECQYSSRLSLETIRGYKAVFNLLNRLVPEIQNDSEISTELLVIFFQRLETRERVLINKALKTGVKKSTIKTYWSKLNSFLGWLERKAYIKTNPMGKIKPPELTYYEEIALTDFEVRKLYAAVTLHSKNALILRRDTMMLSLLLFCGIRLGEFIAIEIRDIDFLKQMLTIRGTTSKSRKTRFIPIHPTLMFHLKDYIVERNKHRYTTPYLIISTGSDRGLSRHGLKHWVKSLSIKSGVKFHLHQFRHSFACNLAKKDVNAVKIQKLLGHSSLNMTMTYLRSIQSEDLKEEINRLSI